MESTADFGALMLLAALVGLAGIALLGTFNIGELALSWLFPITIICGSIGLALTAIYVVVNMYQRWKERP